MSYVSTQQLVERACKTGTVIPAFNIPYLPMVEPVVKALKDTNSF
jgi:fructose-bisphosphate aldolase class II